MPAPQATNLKPRHQMELWIQLLGSTVDCDGASQLSSKNIDDSAMLTSSESTHQAPRKTTLERISACCLDCVVLTSAQHAQAWASEPRYDPVSMLTDGDMIYCSNMEPRAWFENMLVCSCGTSSEHWLMRSWERELFGGAYDDAKGFDRCKYGALQLGRRGQDSKGQMDCQRSSLEMIRSNCSSLSRFIDDFCFRPQGSHSLCKRCQRVAIDFKAFLLFLPPMVKYCMYTF